MNSLIRKLAGSQLVARIAFNPASFYENLKCVPVYSRVANYATYKTPTNRGKKFEPTTVAVTKANQHLEIAVFDEKDLELGRMSMGDAKKLADEKELKLAIVDESTDPPKFKLMSGKDLFKAQMKSKEDHGIGAAAKLLREKEIDFNLGISDHDFQIKMKILTGLYEKGHPIKIKINSKLSSSEFKDVNKLQSDFIAKLTKACSFAKIKTQKVNENVAILQIQSKNQK